MSPVLPFPKAVTGDFIIAEFEPIITRESQVITNGTGAAITYAAGYPMNGNTPVVAANIATITGLLLEKAVVPANSTKQVAILARGPAAVNFDALPTADVAAANYTAATFITSIKGLGIVVRREPTQSLEQTT